MKVRKIISVCMSIILCFLMMSPAYALDIDQPTMYSVKILPGNGRILTNNEEAIKSFYNPNYFDYQYHFVYASPSDFEEIEDIETEVGESETVKNRINYSAEGLEEDWHEWYNDAFVTGTKTVRGILSNGINTRHTGAFFSGFVYPRFNQSVYLFVPNNEDEHFSHFVDQDGNRFGLNEPVTKDLVLTPIYTTDEVTETLFNKEIHQVRFEKGEGTIKRCSDGSLHYYRRMDDWDEIVINVLDGDKTFDRIDKAFALQKYCDLESSNDFLHKSADLVLNEIDADHPARAIELFINSYIQGINEHFFSDPKFTKYFRVPVDEEGNPKYEKRNNNISLAFVLTVWMEFFGEGYTTEDMLMDTIEKAMNYDTQTESEQAETIEQMKNVLFAFSDAWDNYLLAEYKYLDECPCFITQKIINGSLAGVPIYYVDENAFDPAWLFVPPSDNYVFSHFEDQDGNKFVLGEDEVTRDLVLTPIYYSRFDSRLEENITGKIFVDTEDNSDEEFNVSVIRNHKNTLNEVFDKGDYDGTEYEYLNDKSSYHFDESDWVIAADGTITDYTGELVQMLGIPETINGITVTGVDPYAFSSLYDRFLDSYTGPYTSEAPHDYRSRHPMSVWIPKTVERFSQGDEAIAEKFKTDMLENIYEELEWQGKSEEDIENCIEYYEAALEVTLEESGTNNCTPLAYLPLSYVVVEDGNPNYTSLGGSLYNKDMTVLLYLSCAIYLDEIRYYSEDMYRGIEIPNTVTTISAFATYNAIKNDGSYSLLHFYGHTVFDVYYAFMNIHVNTPEGDYLEELCNNKFGKSYEEIEDMIASFDDPPDEVMQSFEETMADLFTAAEESGIIDENGDLLVSDEEAAAFVIPYYYSWWENHPEYHFYYDSMTIAMYANDIVDLTTGELTVSEEELKEWQNQYVITYSNGAVRYDDNGELIPNLTDEEIAEMEAVADRNEAGKLYRIEDACELYSVSWSLLTFILITNQENVDAAEEPFRELYALLNPNASQSTLNEAWEAFYIFVQASTDFVGHINRYGVASGSNPMETVFVADDNYTYIAYLTDIPERYIKPDVVELNPSDENMRNGTITLRLKRGNVVIETVDAYDTSKHLEAQYVICDSNGNEIATDITNLSDLTYGTYTVMQISVEDGYMPNTEIQSFSILQNGDTVRLVFKNHTTNNLYSVRIPKIVVLDGKTGYAACAVSAMGNINADRKIVISPTQSAFSVEEQYAHIDRKSPIELTVQSEKTVWLSNELFETEWSSSVWTLSAPLTAGVWKGRIQILISIEET